MANLLLIDDDPLFVVEQVRQAFPTYNVTVAANGADGIATFRSAPPDVVLLDLQLPDCSGLDVYEELRRVDARVPVIFVTVAKTADTAIEAMKRGAFNYVYKPLDLGELQATVRDAIDVSFRMRAPVLLQPTLPHLPETDTLVGACPAMLEVYKAIGLVAQQDVTVLVTGETGTGKELVARAIYQHSARSKAPYLALNCAAIPENLLESDLLGHEKGAFTGADRRRIGKFEQHSGGTIFSTRSAICRCRSRPRFFVCSKSKPSSVWEGTRPIRTDVRLIAATHRDLRARVAEGKFRLDLYYRLGVFTIHLPPLRERGGDIPLLAQHFVRRFSQELGRDIRSIAPDAMERLCAYSWPGNIRELQNVLKQSVLRAQGVTLLSTFLPPLTDHGTSTPHTPRMPEETPLRATIGACDLEGFIRQRLVTLDGNNLYAETRQYADRFLFTLALERTQGNHRAAAQVLGISRQTMRVKLRALGISVAHSIRARRRLLTATIGALRT